MSAAINWLDLDGVVNMRDLGGLPTTDGSTLRPGRLLRSDNLQDLSPSAVQPLVQELRITDVAVLRRHQEVESEGTGEMHAWARGAHHNITLLPEPATSPRPL